nr:hypothetical protein [Staphylococcus pseudintermedius]
MSGKGYTYTRGSHQRYIYTVVTTMMKVSRSHSREKPLDQVIEPGIDRTFSNQPWFQTSSVAQEQHLAAM